jgi:hypothetical protein
MSLINNKWHQMMHKKLFKLLWHMVNLHLLLIINAKHKHQAISK